MSLFIFHMQISRNCQKTFSTKNRILELEFALNLMIKLKRIEITISTRKIHFLYVKYTKTWDQEKLGETPTPKSPEEWHHSITHSNKHSFATLQEYKIAPKTPSNRTIFYRIFDSRKFTSKSSRQIIKKKFLHIWDS